jgi:hypothetical protein
VEEDLMLGIIEDDKAKSVDSDSDLTAVVKVL